MKIVLIAPPIMDNVGRRLVPIAMDAHRECPPYGMYLLQAVLEDAGHEVCFIDLIAAGSYSIADWADEFADAGLVGLGATSMSWPTALLVIEQVRELNSQVPIVAGGIHPTMFDQYILSAFAVEFVVRGEGEIAIVSLVEALETHRDFARVPNLSWRDRDGTIVRNQIDRLITREDLPSFPVPDYGRMPAGVYQSLSIESSRGCVFDCSFCSTSYRRTWRGISPEEFVDRLEAIMPHCDRTTAGHIHIIDDEFSMNVKRATQIANIIAARGLQPGLVFDSRANDILSEEYVASMKPFTTQFLIGAECGYDEGLGKIGKGTTCEKLIGAAEMLHRHGMAERADFSFVLGLPWEGREEIEKTIAFAARLHGQYGVRILLQWYCQIPGSRLWDAACREGLVTEAMYDDFGFFGNYYLFQSGVKIATDDIYEVSERVAAIQTLARVRYPATNMVEYAFPEPVAKYYPRILKTFTGNGLESLRQVAKPGSKAAGKYVPADAPSLLDRQRVGLPLRHFEGIG